MIADLDPALRFRTVLLVAVAASDPVRAADLSARAVLAGHRVVESGADIVLADADAVVGPGVTALRLDDRGDLPAALSPVQLDAALRAAAVGLRVSLPQAGGPVLTPREAEVLACLGEGLSNKAVARRLGISAHTVKFHLEAVFDKLGASSRADAVAKGLRCGLLRL